MTNTTPIFITLTNYFADGKIFEDTLVQVDKIVRTEPKTEIAKGLVVLVTESTGNTRFPYVSKEELIQKLKSVKAI